MREPAEPQVLVVRWRSTCIVSSNSRRSSADCRGSRKAPHVQQQSPHVQELVAGSGAVGAGSAEILSWLITGAVARDRCWTGSHVPVSVPNGGRLRNIVRMCFIVSQ